MPNKNWTKKKEASDNPSAAVHNLLKVLDIPATYNHVDKTLQEHPDFPSLLTLAESLPEWGVKTEGVKGEISDLTEVDYPSIVHLNVHRAGQDFAVLQEVHDGQADIIHPADGRRTLSLDEFAGIWTGVLLRAFPGEKTGERDYEAHLKTQRMSRFRRLLTVAGLPLLFLLAFGCGLAQVGSLGTLIPLGLAKAVGFVLCVIMVAAGLGQGSTLNSLCPMGRVANCHRVMQSPAGRLFGVSMAEWGLLYFGGGLLSLLAAFFFGQVQNDLFLIGVLGLLALPYTLFSVIYQAFVVRSWCWMCLVVQVLFWVEFYLMHDIVLPRFGKDLPSLTFPFSLLLGFGVTALVWLALRHAIASARQADAYKSQVIRLRRQPDYIQMQLGKAAPTNMGNLPFEAEVGPGDAKIAMTMVVNPLCGHCWRAFNEMDQIIKVGRGQIKANIRFLVSAEDKNQNETEKMLDREVSLRILAMAEQGDRERVYRALRSWFAEDDRFSKGKFDRWISEFPSNSGKPHEEAAVILANHREWAKRCGIMGTPTVFFGGRRLERGLQLGDLKIFLIRQQDGQ